MTSLHLLTDYLHFNNFSMAQKQKEQIDHFLNLVLKWNKTINLTAHRNLTDLIEKDIIDNLYLNQLIQKQIRPQSILDMGSGGGFSGILLSILNSDLSISYLDSDRKKMNFVKQVYRDLDLKKGHFLNIRAEANPIEWKNHFQLSISRATWKLEEYLKYAHYYVQIEGYALLMIGKSSQKSPSENEAYQGFAAPTYFFYTIKPKNYERALLLRKKNKVIMFHVKHYKILI